MNTVWWLCGIMTFFVATIANGAEIYIAPTGNDAAAGTIGAPLATLAAARDKADQLKANNTPVTVYLRGGTYYLSASVVFGPANSGTATAPIVYMAFPGEKPVLSGGIKVPTTAWSTSSGQIMVTTIDQNLSVDQLFLNGNRQVLARYPNFSATTPILDGYAADCISASRISRWNNPVEGPGYIRGLHINMWGGNSFIITGKSGTSITQQWVGDNNRGSGLHATYRMVENLYEELDAAGEWFYRKSTGQLFFWPPSATNLNSSTIVLASQDELIKVVGSSSVKTSYLAFKGLTFAHTHRTLFDHPYDSLLMSDWRIARTGTVFLENAENIRVESCFFDQIGGNGVFVNGYNRNHVIFNNTFIDAGASCVVLAGLRSSVRCPSSWANNPGCNDKTPGPLTADYPAFITVDNNMMNHFGRFEKQTAGVAVSMSQCDTIRHNTIHDCPRACITINDGCWGGHVIEYNWLYNNVLETGDHGPFNAWGRDRNIRWPDDTSATTLDAWKTTIVRNNRIEPRQGDFGLDMDDHASNYYAYNNLIFGGGIKFIGTMRKNTYVNNILLKDSQVKVFGGQITKTSSFYMTRNIIANNQPYAFGSNTPDYFKQNTKMVDSNFYSAASTQVCGDQCFTWAQWHTAGLDVHSLLVNATFTDTAKVFPNNYAPRGDFAVTSPTILGLGFKNFPMDSFGVMQVSQTAVQNPGAIVQSNEQETGLSSIHFSNGHLAVSHSGNYQVRITTVNGRTVTVLHGIHGSVVYINTNRLSPGMYFAVVEANRSSQIKRFIVNE